MVIWNDNKKEKRVLCDKTAYRLFRNVFHLNLILSLNYLQPMRLILNGKNLIISPEK